MRQAAGPILWSTKRKKMGSSTKIALVTGGNRGLGKDMVFNLARRGNDTVITYNSGKAEADEVVGEIAKLGRKAVAIQLNTGKIESFDKFVTTLKGLLRSEFDSERIDFLVNNAGFNRSVPSLEQTSVELFDELMNVHFKGVFFLTQKLLPDINDNGAIINISSGLTRFAFPGSGTYASMKGAVETLTKYMAKELAPRKIRANIVAPGAIATDFNGGHVRDTKELNDRIAAVTALGRVGLAGDIGGVVAFLCSDEARWITGQRIEASGGMFL